MCIHRRVLLHVFLYALDCFAFVVFVDVDLVGVLLFRVCTYIHMCVLNVFVVVGVLCVHVRLCICC